MSDRPRRSKEEMTALAGDYDAIPWLDLHYDDWLWLQHFWQREALGLQEGEPLAVALEALDRITRLSVNGSSQPYWIARMALRRLGLWPDDEDVTENGTSVESEPDDPQNTGGKPEVERYTSVRWPARYQQP